MKIKSGRTPKVSSLLDSNKERFGICNGYPVFCFRYLTTNNKYNFDKMDGAIYQKLLERLTDLSGETWKSILLEGKIRGADPIPYGELNFKIKNDEIVFASGDNSEKRKLDDDTKVFSFRFGNQNYRMIGLKRNNCSILHIIGFDLDFSAYNHGK